MRLPNIAISAALAALLLAPAAPAVAGDALSPSLRLAQLFNRPPPPPADIDEAPAGVDPALDMNISYLLLGGTYVGAGELVRPFLAAGIGAAHLSPDRSGYGSDTVFAVGIGGGAQVFPTERVGLRMEVRALGAVIDSHSNIFCASGPEGSACAVSASGNMLWQWEAFAGLVARF